MPGVGRKPSILPRRSFWSSDHAYDIRGAPGRERITVAAVLLRHGVGRHVDHLALDHRRDALVQRREADQRALADIDMRDLARIDARLDDQLVVDG